MNKEFLTRDEALVWMVNNPGKEITDINGFCWQAPLDVEEFEFLMNSPELEFKNPDYIPPKKPEPITFEEAVERLKRGVPVLFLCPIESEYKDLSALIDVLEAWTIMRSLYKSGIPLYAENPGEGEGCQA